MCSALLCYARLRGRVDSVGGCFDWGGGFEGHVVYVFNELEVAVHNLVPGNKLSAVRGDASHQRGHLGLARPAGLVVPLVLADSVGEN